MSFDKIKALFLILVFFLYTILVPSMPSILKIILDFAIILLAILSFRETFQKDTIQLKGKKLKTIGYIFLGFICVLLMQGITGSIIDKLFGVLPPSSEGQMRLLNSNPVYLIFSMLIFSPIVDQLTFRKAFRDLIPNQFLFVLLSSLIYGTIYVIFGVTEAISYIFIISYTLIAMLYALFYLKSDNIYVPIGMHVLQNAMAIMMYLLLQTA